MTKLVGQDGGGWTIVNQTEPGAGGSCWYFAAGYVAVATGTATNFHVTVQTTSSAALATAYLYAGAGVGATLVATSAEFSVSSTGDKTPAVSASITAGNTYTLVLQPASGFFGVATNSGSNGFVDNQNLVANFPYRAAPGTIPARDSQSGQEFVIWIDGTLPVLVPQPLGGPPRIQMHWR
jgi:hypothetical protein